MDGGLDRCMRSAHHIAADRLDIRSYDGQDSFGNDSVGTVSDANEAKPRGACHGRSVDMQGVRDAG